MKFYTRKRRNPTVIIVALIDIFVILLIFVIATSTFKRAQPSVVLKLPESSEAKPGATEGETALVLTISAEGKIFLDERPVPVDSLADALREAGAPRQPVALRADTEAPFGMVVRVMDALKAAGISGNLPAFTELKSK